MSGNLLEVGKPYWTQGEGADQWPLNKHSNVLSRSLVVKTGPGKLYGFSVLSTNVGAQFVLLWDRVDVPANGDTTLCQPFVIAAAGNLGISWGDVGRTFLYGCVLTNSTTAGSQTAGALDCWFDAQYI